MNEQETLELFKKMVREAGGQRSFARTVGLSAPYINDVYHGRRAIGPTLLKVLGLKVETHREYRETK